jgi:hypothetical protein
MAVSLSLRLGLWVAFIAASSHPVRAAQLPQSGCVEWQRTQALRLEGAIEAGGLTGTVTFLVDPRDGRNVATWSFGSFSEAAGFDGRVGWAQDRSGGSHDLNAAAARAISTTEAWLFRRGWCSERDVTIEPLPSESTDGVTERAWRVTPRDGIPVTLRFDRASGVLHQAEYRLWGNRLIRHYDDWRDVGQGVKVAFSERDEDPEDEDTRTIALTSVKLDAKPFPPSAFARPARPRDYAIRGGADSATVDYEDDGGARLYVPVFVNGKGPYAFEVDTGGHLIIGADLSASLGLAPVGAFANTGAGTGITQTGVVTNQEIRIGDAVLYRQVAKVRPFANDRVTGKPPRSGLLGLELFERFAVQVDRARKTITLTPLEKFPGGRGTALPIHFIEDAPLTQGAYDGHPGDFEIDSGNAGPTIIEGYWAHEQGLDTSLSAGLAWHAGSGSNGYQEWLTRADLSLGAIKFPHQLVSYVGQPVRGSESTRLQAGVAGEWLLRCFDTTYDYERGVVWLGARHDCPGPSFNRAGLRVANDGGTLVAAAVLPGTPAAAAGIAAGDRIISIGGKEASVLTAKDAGVLLAGPIGVELEIVFVSKSGGDRRTARLKLEELVP